MCRISEKRLLPRNASDGQIAVWSAAQNRWVAQNNSGGGGGSSFDPSEDQDITGNYSFSQPVTFEFNGASPTVPGSGFKKYASATHQISYLFASGLRYSYDYSNLTGNRTLTIPNANGTIALVDTGNLRLGAPLDGTLRNVIDHAGTSSPLQLSTSKFGVIGSDRNPFSVTGSRGGGLWFGDISSTEGAVWSKAVTPNDSNYSFYIGETYSGINSPGSTGVYFNVQGSGLGRITANGWYLGSGAVSAGARLQVRGDGSNPIQRWQNNVGSNLADFTNTGLINFLATDTGISYSNSSIKFLDSLGTIDYSNINASNLAYHRFRSPSWATTGDQKIIGIETTYSAPAGNANFRPLSITYTVSNSGAQAGSLSSIYVNAVESSLNGIAHNFMSLNLGGVNRYNLGLAGAGRNPYMTMTNGSYITSIYAGDGGSNAAWIGTETNHSFGILTNNQYRLVATSSGDIIIGSASSASARQHTRGDGINPIARFETNTAQQLFGVASGSALASHAIEIGASYKIGNKLLGSDIWRTSGQYGVFEASNNLDWPSYHHTFRNVSNSLFTNPQIAGTTGILDLAYGTFGINYSGGNNIDFRGVNISYTINNSNSNSRTGTGIFLNATVTNRNGMTHNLIDLQADSVSYFRVNPHSYLTTISTELSVGGNVSIPSANFLLWTGRGRNRFNENGVFVLTDNSGSDMGRVCLGGTTDLYPAIKRVGGGIRVVAADDSRFADIEAREYSASTGFFAPNSTEVRGTYIRGRGNTFMTFGDGTPGIVIENTTGTLDNTAIFQLNSTTKGFLAPRMIENERDSIVSPAQGLNLYNTESNRPEFYTTKWEGAYLTGRDLIPDDDNTYYLGKNSLTNPKSFKGLIVKDINTATLYRIEVASGTLRAQEIS